MTQDTHTERYHHTLCGLDNVYIENMPVRRDDKGEPVYEIPAVNLLHALISYAISKSEGQLQPSELRFLRTELGYTQAELARFLKKEPQTIGRWERDEHPIDKTAEILIRIKMLDMLEQMGVFGYIEASRDTFSIEQISSYVNDVEKQPIILQCTKDQRYTLVA